jgi:hypothetical protein
MVDAPKSKYGFGTGVVVGAALGILVGIVISPGLLAANGLSTTTGVASTSDFAPGAPRLPVTLGKGSRRYGRATFPVVVRNTSGEHLGYLRADCVFYDANGSVVGTDFTNWTDVGPGETSSGTVSVEAASASRAECSAKAG